MQKNSLDKRQKRDGEEKKRKSKKVNKSSGLSKRNHS